MFYLLCVCSCFWLLVWNFHFIFISFSESQFLFGSVSLLLLLISIYIFALIVFFFVVHNYHLFSSSNVLAHSCAVTRFSPHCLTLLYALFAFTMFFFCSRFSSMPFYLNMERENRDGIGTQRINNLLMSVLYLRALEKFYEIKIYIMYLYINMCVSSIHGKIWFILIAVRSRSPDTQREHFAYAHIFKSNFFSARIKLLLFPSCWSVSSSI